ncbi:MAG: porin [Rhodobacteraceae bacterium]|nr:porin [Paracoccaceae bacterium]
MRTISRYLLLASIAGSAAQADEATGWDVYGQLSFGLLAIDNGAGSESYFAENGHIPSRVGIWYRHRLSSGGLLKFNFETGLGFTDLSEVSPDNDSLDFEYDKTALRKLEVVYVSPSAGTFSFGQGSMASDGASGVDLSGTGFAHAAAIGDLGGGTEFLLAGGTGSNVFVGDVFDDLDGPRRFRLRYDTPEWQSLTVSVAAGREVLRSGDDRAFYDVALAYVLETDAYSAEAILSYEWIDSSEERVLFSAGVLHMQTGLNVSIATGANQIGAGEYTYLKVGLQRDLFEIGRTAVSLEYYDGNDLGGAGSNSEAFGIGISQQVDAFDVEIVGALRRYDASRSATQFQSIDVAMLVARWRF